MMLWLALAALCALAWWMHRRANDVPQPGKLTYLDGLRGVAAFVVVIFHFLLGSFPAIPSGDPAQAHHTWEAFLPYTPLYIAYSGSFAVAIFFVMSGLVLSYPFFIRKSREVPLSAAARRYLRLGIPVVATTLIYCALMQAGAISAETLSQIGKIVKSPTLADMYAFAPSWLDALQQGLVNTFFYGEFKYNPVLWTMQVEFFGSMLVFAFCLFFGESRHRWVAYLLLSPLIWLRAEYGAFLIGMILCDILVHDRLALNRPVKILLVSIGLYLGAYPHFIKPELMDETLYSWTAFLPGLDFKQASWLVMVLGAGCMLTVLVQSNKLQAFFDTRLCQFLGQISFSLYLTHIAVMMSVSPQMFLALYESMSFSYAAATCFLLTIPVMIAVATLNYHWVEKPAITLAGNYYRHWFKPVLFRAGEMAARAFPKYAHLFLPREKSPARQNVHHLQTTSSSEAANRK